RNSAMDARNFFDRGADPPPFTRNQFGATAGGPIRRNRLFFFGGVERLQEDLGVTQVTTVPSLAARSGALGAINPLTKPYLDLFPAPNGPDVGAASSGIAQYTFEINQPTRENFIQGRVDVTLSDRDSLFGRYTYDGADQTVPAGFEAYGTDSVSRNQFFTVEHKRIVTPALLNTASFSHSRLRCDQLPERAAIPGGQPQSIRGGAARRATRARAAQHAVRLLPAGRRSGDEPADAQFGPTLRGVHDSRRRERPRHDAAEHSHGRRFH